MTATILHIRGPVEVSEKHWLLWAEQQRGGGDHLGYSPQWGFVGSADDQVSSVRQLMPCTPRDNDIAEAVGMGMESLAGRMPEKAQAVHARYGLSEHVYMRRLAAKLGVSPARVSQMADEGQRLVEQWVVQTYAD